MIRRRFIGALGVAILSSAPGAARAQDAAALQKQLETQQADLVEQEGRIRDLEKKLGEVLARQKNAEKSPPPPVATPAPAPPPPRPAQPGILDTLLPEFLKNLTISAYVQGQYEVHQDAQDQLDPSGSPLNTDRFVLRRARIKLEKEWQYASTMIELDGNTVNGPAFNLWHAEASVLYRGERPFTAPPILKLTFGLFDTPFGYELVESPKTRWFMERSQVSRALWPGEPDLGARLSTALGWFRGSVAILNGNPIGEKVGFPLRDPAAAKDIVARAGAELTPVPWLFLAGGVSVYNGKGFHPGTGATKNAVQWIDTNGDGLIEPNELIGVAATSATPSMSFDRWAVGGHPRAEMKTPIGPTRLTFEVVIANNMDRGLFIADPILTGIDNREVGYTLGATQEILGYGVAGFRFDSYNPALRPARQLQGGQVLPLVADGAHLLSAHRPRPARSACPDARPPALPVRRRAQQPRPHRERPPHRPARRHLDAAPAGVPMTLLRHHRWGLRLGLLSAVLPLFCGCDDTGVLVSPVSVEPLEVSNGQFFPGPLPTGTGPAVDFINTPSTPSSSPGRRGSERQRGRRHGGHLRAAALRRSGQRLLVGARRDGRHHDVERRAHLGGRLQLRGRHPVRPPPARAQRDGREGQRRAGARAEPDGDVHLPVGRAQGRRGDLPRLGHRRRSRPAPGRAGRHGARPPAPHHGYHAGADGGLPEGTAVLDRDSNASCVEDGYREEDAVFADAPAPGTYIVRVDMFVRVRRGGGGLRGHRAGPRQGDADGQGAPARHGRRRRRPGLGPVRGPAQLLGDRIMLIERLERVALLGSTWVLYLMMLLSVLSISVMIERLVYFALHGGDADKLGDKLIERLHADDRAGAERLLRESPLVEAAVVRRALPWMDGGPASLSEALDAQMGRKRKELERGMTFLGTLGNNAPFIGLFGTVLGVIQAFHQLGEGQNKAAMGNVMSGIAEALIATGVGLVVALPAVVAFNVAQKRIGEIEGNVTSIGKQLLALLSYDPRLAARSRKHAEAATPAERAGRREDERRSAWSGSRGAVPATEA